MDLLCMVPPVDALPRPGLRCKTCSCIAALLVFLLQAGSWISPRIHGDDHYDIDNDRCTSFAHAGEDICQKWKLRKKMQGSRGAEGCVLSKSCWKV